MHLLAASITENLGVAHLSPVLRVSQITGQVLCKLHYSLKLGVLFQVCSECWQN